MGQMMGQPYKAGDLGEVARLSLKLGFLAFGGPAAHIAMLRGEVVERRKWMTDQHFLDLIGMTNLIPGPNSTEMVIHTGYERAGWRGLIAAGSCFILPAFLLVLILSYLYVEFGTSTTGEWLLYGIKPVVIAIVGQAIWGLTRTAVINQTQEQAAIMVAAGVGVFLLYLIGISELVLLFGGAIVAALAINWRRMRDAALTLSIAPFGALSLLLATDGASAGYSHTRLFLQFLKIGAVLYGSGYVLLAFLQSTFVEDLGWLTHEQLIDGVAIGQFTPGPVFTTAAFVGYVSGGFGGAVLATLGIFIPSFIFVALTRPVVPRVRNSPWAGALLDGVNAAALGLMAAVTLELARSAIVDVVTFLMAAVAITVLIRVRPNSAWIIIGGAVFGIAYKGIF